LQIYFVTFHPKEFMQKIDLQKVVSISYELEISVGSEDEPELLETTTADDPMLFLFGESGLPERFEEELMGKTTGDTFDFVIPPEFGYGDYSEDDVVMLPLEVFEVDGKIDTEIVQPGRTLPMNDGEGNTLRGTVLEVGQAGILMDFNHPLAGKTLHFKGKVEDIRPATAEEIAHGHVHGPGGHQH
jgi:FKBP-type peptidyl-prolyl cis-trans isomerase SlyD